MRKRLIAIILMLSICSTVILESSAEIQKPKWAPEASSGLAFETKYIWRGQLMVDAPVLQPEASLSKYGLTLSYWGNFSTDSSQERFTEHDYTVDYTFNIGKSREFLCIETDTLEFINPIDISFGQIFYVFPEYSGENFHTEEVYLGISYDILLEPAFTWYLDYGRGAGSYLELSIGHTFDMAKDVDIGLGITAGYNAGQWGYGYKLAPILFFGEVNITVFKYFTITPNINYSLAVDRTREDKGLAYSSEFYGGVKIGIAI